MIAIFSLLLVFAVSLLIDRIGTIALTMTGLTNAVIRATAETRASFCTAAIYSSETNDGFRDMRGHYRNRSAA